MKPTNLLIIGLFFLLSSCAGTRSIDRFYNQHKDDDQVTAVRIPRVMLDLVSGISPEMESVIGNTEDIRFMKFDGLNPASTRSLNFQMNQMTQSSFIEVYRKNEQSSRNIISIREKRNTVKEILVYNTNSLNATLLYLNGNFDPARVRALAESDQFNAFAKNLAPQ